jgi:hypothetical protein
VYWPLVPPVFSFSRTGSMVDYAAAVAAMRLLACST